MGRVRRAVERFVARIQRIKSMERQNEIGSLSFARLGSHPRKDPARFFGGRDEKLRSHATAIVAVLQDVTINGVLSVIQV